LGVVSALAKGALRPKSRFVTALRLLSEGQAGLILSRHSDLHTLISFEPVRLHVRLAERLDRYAAASALGELMLRFAPQEPHPESFEFLRHALDVLEAAPGEAVAVLGLRMLWGLVDRLGFAPGLDRCVRDVRPVSAAESAAFSTAEGGVVCGACAGNGTAGAMLEVTQIPATDRADLRALIHGAGDLPALDQRHLVAHQRLLDRYIRHHVAEGAPLPALAFWAERGWEER